MNAVAVQNAIPPGDNKKGTKEDHRTAANGKWDTTYEWKVVTLLGIGFGLVGLDRWIIAPLGPTMAADLGLSPGDIGYLVGALGLTWGVFAIFSGRLADSIGHRKILIPAILVFSLMSGLSGMASGMVGLIFIRALMGAAEGAYTPTSFTAVASAAKPERRGILQGAQQCGFALFGLALGPIIATQLLQVVPSWRWVFWIVAIPGFIVAALLYYVLKEPEDTQGGATVGAALTADQTRSSYMELLKTPNIVVAMLLLFCTMSCVFVLSAMVPGYLEGYIGFTPQQQGAVLSGIGFGGFIGQFGIPGLSDRFGRRPMAIISFIGATVTVWIFFQLGANPLALFLTIFAVSFFSLGVIALITGPIATEAAPLGLVSAAIGIVVGTGEIFGGGIAPAIAGWVTNNYGIENVVWVALFGVAIGIVLSFFLKETAPIKQAE